MSVPLPTITRVTPVDYTASGVLTAMHAHFTATPARFVLDLTSSAGPGDGFALTSVADPDAQYIFRRTGAQTIAVSIQPGATITDVGDVSTSPTGTDATYSGAEEWTIDATCYPFFWVVEFDDAFFALLRSTEGTMWRSSVHIGNVYQPDFPSVDRALGRDGLGFFTGPPITGPAYTGQMIGSPTTTYSRIRISSELWVVPQTPSYSSDNVTVIHDRAKIGFERPYSIPVQGGRTAGGLSAATAVNFGTLKYMFVSLDAEIPMTRFTMADSALAFINGGGLTVANNGLLIPWVNGEAIH